MLPSVSMLSTNIRMPDCSMISFNLQECNKAKCHYAEHHFTKLNYAEYHYAQLHYANLHCAVVSLCKPSLCQFTLCLSVIAECQYAYQNSCIMLSFNVQESQSAKCHYAECHYAKCHGTSQRHLRSHKNNQVFFGGKINNSVIYVTLLKPSKGNIEYEFMISFKISNNKISNNKISNNSNN
jgi:hypothetical protein